MSDASGRSLSTSTRSEMSGCDQNRGLSGEEWCPDHDACGSWCAKDKPGGVSQRCTSKTAAQIECALPAGHDSWHKDGTGFEWSHPDALVAVLEVEQRR